MRPNCLECTIKHLTQAAIQMDEALMGYPLHRYLAWGQMAEASSECLENYPFLANDIRDHRKLYMMDNGYKVPIMKLLSQLDALLADERTPEPVKVESESIKRFEISEKHTLEFAAKHNVCRICGLTTFKYAPIIEHAHQQCLYPLGCRRCNHEMDKHTEVGCVECENGSCKEFIAYNIELNRAKADAAKEAAETAEKAVKELPDDLPF